MFHSNEEKPIRYNSNIKRNQPIEKNIHLIWLGSAMKDHHIDRAIEWTTINRNYKVIVWVEPPYELAIKKQLEDTNVITKSISSIDIPKNISSIIQKFIEPREDQLPPNYAAPSDIYRFFILNRDGGWYVDTDIIPIDVSKLKINKKLNFHINASHKGYDVSQSPSVIASSSNNTFTEAALEIINAMSKEITDQNFQLIRSKLASVRMLATHISTGSIMINALSKILIDGNQLIEMNNWTRYIPVAYQF